MECGAFQSVPLDPLSCSCEDRRIIVIESKHEATIDLNSILVKEAHTTSVIFHTRSALMRRGEVFIAQRLEADENACAPGERHFANKRRIVGDIKCHCSAPDLFERCECATEGSKIFGLGPKVVINEN